MMNEAIAKFAAENNIDPTALTGLTEFLVDRLTRDPKVLDAILADRALFATAIEIGVKKYHEQYIEFCNNVIAGINGNPNPDYDLAMKAAVDAFYTKK